MEFRILGPLEAVAEGDAVSLGAAKPRALLAILLLHANEQVSSDRLIEALWAEQPPATAAKVLQSYISQLRRALGNGTIATRPAGYELRVEPGGLDSHRFERLVTEARGADPPAAARKLRKALALWRGPPLVDFAFDPWAQAEIPGSRSSAWTPCRSASTPTWPSAGTPSWWASSSSSSPSTRCSERLRGQHMLALYRRADRRRLSRPTGTRDRRWSQRSGSSRGARCASSSGRSSTRIRRWTSLRSTPLLPRRSGDAEPATRRHRSSAGGASCARFARSCAGVTCAS